MPKRKRSSKKAHKKIDVTDIESFVHDQVRENDERKAISSKPDEELFVDDKKAPKGIPVNSTKIKKPDRAALLEKRQRKLEKDLEKRNLLANLLKDATRNKPKAASTSKKRKATYDLWGDSEHSVANGVDREWVEPTLKKSVLPPKGFAAKPSALPAVEIEGGSSYRPTYEAHQDLLASAVAVELRKKAKEKKWSRMLQGERADAPKLENVPEVDDLTRRDDDEVEIKEEEESEEEKKHNPFSTKLTRTQRNKMQRQKEQERQRAKKLELKAQRRKFEKLPVLLQEIEETEELKQKESEERKKRKEEKELYGTKRLGPHKFDEGLKHVLLSDELPQSLRELQPANLFTERFKSLQKRNLIEPRKKVPKQKRTYKLKKYQKRSAKMEGLDF